MGHDVLEGDISIKTKGGSKTHEDIETMRFEFKFSDFKNEFPSIDNVVVKYLI